MRTLTAIALYLTLALASCASKTPADFNNDKDMYEYALKLYNQKSYTEAVTFFETVKNKYPTSPNIVDAEYKLAECYFKKGDFIEAIYAFQSFNSLHPTNPKVPEALYKISVSYYKQAPGSVDRDQTNTTNCINVLEDLLRRYPEFPDALKARELLSKCKRMLAERELYIANFYLKQKSYNAALARLEPLKETEDFKDIKEEVLYKLAWSHMKLKENDKSKEYLDTLLKMAPGEKYKRKAVALLSKIERK